MGRFESDLEISLHSYSYHLSLLGNYEEALEYIRQSVEIGKQLSENHHDRFDSAYSISLSNYAIRLTEIGKIKEAINQNEEALRLVERLAQRSPLRFSEDVFRLSCYSSWLAWLADLQIPDVPDPEVLFPSISPHSRPLMMFFLNFVFGCITHDPATRQSQFDEAFSNWSKLHITSQRQGEPYWLCMNAWCQKFYVGSAQSVWIESWHSFSAQRSGRIPAWMLELARRLDFQWPA